MSIRKGHFYPWKPIIVGQVCFFLVGLPAKLVKMILKAHFKELSDFFGQKKIWWPTHAIVNSLITILTIYFINNWESNWEKSNTKDPNLGRKGRKSPSVMPLGGMGLYKFYYKLGKILNKSPKKFTNQTCSLITIF